MAIPDPPKAGSPFCALWTGGWNPKTPEINNFYSRNYSPGGLSPARPRESAFGAGPGGSGSMSHPWQKTEPVGVKTDGLAKSEAYGLWQYDMI